MQGIFSTPTDRSPQFRRAVPKSFGVSMVCQLHQTSPNSGELSKVLGTLEANIASVYKQETP
jgi:hypothetical protein